MTEPVRPSAAATGRPTIIFLATREPGYSRVAIVYAALQEQADVIPFVSTFSRYPLRVMSVVGRFFFAWLTGRLRTADALCVGFFAQPVCPVLRLLWRKTLICDAYFSLYDTLVNDKRKARPDSWVARICFWLDRFMLRNSDLVLTDTLAHRDYFRQQFGETKAVIERLWISAQDQLFAPLPHLERAQDETFRVCFWGGFIPLQGVDVIVQAAARLKEFPIEFQLAGEGQTFPEAVALAQELGCTNVTFLGWQTAESIRAIVANSHLILGIFGTSEKAGRVIPNKAFEALALRKPLLTANSSAAQELFIDGQNAMLVPPGDPVALAEKIIWARAHQPELHSMAEHGYTTFMTTASPACVSRLLHQYLGTVMQQKQFDVLGVTA